MKTKNLLFLILILGLSFNTFSQEEVTIKQVLKNSSKSTIKIANDQINYVRVNTSIPVTINKGKENAIYITGEFDGAEDYAGFCTLEDAILKINNPKKGKRITLELANDVNMFYFGNNANVSINKDINVESNGIFGAENNSVAMINSKITGKDLMIRSRNNSKISFYSINVDKLDVKAEKGSEVILNGKTNTLKLDKDEDSKFIKDTFSYSSLYEALELNEDDTILAKGNKIYLKTQEFVSRPKHKRDTLKIDKEGNIINSKGDTITKAEALEEAEYNRLSNSVSHEENVIIGKNARVNITFVDKDKIGTDYVSNYPIKGYENGQLVVQDDYPLDLELTIRNDIGNITLKDGAEVNVLSKINEKQRSYFLFEGAKLNFNNETKIEDLSLQMQNRSKLSFKDLKSDKVFLQGDGTSDLELNGEIKFLDKYKYDDINLKGDYKIDSIKERKIKMFTITTPIPFTSSKSKEDNILNDKVESEKIKAQKQDKDKLNFSLQVGYGILGWSNRVSGIDDLFASPKGQYILRYSDSWSFGFRYDAKISKRWTISSGIGYESNIFRFENNVVLTTINGDRRIDFETNNLIDAESKLVARYVTVPLFIKYRVVKNFTLHAGAIAGVNFRTSSTGFKRDYEQQNKDIEERWGTKYDNFKPLKLDVQAGFGWNSVNFYAKYSLIPLFKDNKEIELYPYSVGVSFGL
ncbi:MAG: outer membrane beta-barrel protein [Bacteroidales bacterium]|nr:outer membrane beta-barrel protein [Bacteroidales bacterium]